MTILELVIVLAILGVIASVVGLAIRVASPVEPDSLDEAQRIIASARRRALDDGRSVVVAVRLRRTGEQAATVRHACALPDGSVLADSTLGIARLSGGPAIGSNALASVSAWR
jgi:hypothetical protein